MNAKHLREVRERLGMTQSDLGAALGLNADTIGRWERRVQPISHPRIVRLALEQLLMQTEVAPRRQSDTASSFERPSDDEIQRGAVDSQAADDAWLKEFE